MWSIPQPQCDVNGGNCIFPRDNDDTASRDGQSNTYTSLHCLRGHRAGITSLAFSPNALLLASGCAKGYMNIWALQDGSVLMTLNDVGIVNTLCWFAEHSLAVNFSRAKDIVIVQCNAKFYHHNKVR